MSRRLELLQKQVVIPDLLHSLELRREAWNDRWKSLGHKAPASKDNAQVEDNVWWAQEQVLIEHVRTAVIRHMNRISKTFPKHLFAFHKRYIEPGPGFAHCAAYPGHLVREAVLRGFNPRLADLSDTAAKYARGEIVQSLLEAERDGMLSGESVGKVLHAMELVVQHDDAVSFLGNLSESSMNVILLCRLLYHMPWDEVVSLSRAIDECSEVGSSVIICQANYKENLKKNHLTHMVPFDAVLGQFPKFKVSESIEFYNFDEPYLLTCLVKHTL